MPAKARELYSAQLNWYLFEPTQVIFAQFWQFIRKAMADKNYNTEQHLFNDGQTALSLARQERLMLGQMCSLTYSKCSPELPTYIGSYILDDAALTAGYYRSVIITSNRLKGQKLSVLEPAKLTAAISEPDSFSGRFALYQALTGGFAPFNFAKTIQTGAHFNTLKAVASASADIGAIATPDLLQWAPSLPKTRSGKIMRRILRKIAADDFAELGDTSTLADPSVVEELIENRQNKNDTPMLK